MKKWTDEYPFNGKSSNVIISVDLWKTIIDEHNRLAELEDKIEQGKMIELPCKVGDTVYVLCKGDYVLVGEKTGWQYTIKKLKSTLSTFSTWEYGKTLFLTKAEAEQKLQEQDNER